MLLMVPVFLGRCCSVRRCHWQEDRRGQIHTAEDPLGGCRGRCRGGCRGAVPCCYVAESSRSSRTEKTKSRRHCSVRLSELGVGTVEDATTVRLPRTISRVSGGTFQNKGFLNVYNTSHLYIVLFIKCWYSVSVLVLYHNVNIQHFK